MITMCPTCEKHVTTAEHKEKTVTLTIRGYRVEVLDKYILCHECGEEWKDPKSDYDILEIAYAKVEEMEANK